jgi:type VI secretion system protein ImpK
MTNNSDDPFAPRDSTIMRPRPGAGRRAANEPFGPSTRRTESVHAPEPPPAQLGELVSAGLNPLLQAANALLVLAGRVRTTLAPSDTGSLRRRALEAVRSFEERAASAGIPSETVLAARYALCATLDEAVLSTPWGAQSDWASQTLLVTLHRETWGGEKFFEMLERISRDPARHIDLMELQYACLALGFTGKFQVLERGQNQLADIQRDLYRRIRAHRGTTESELSPHWRGVENRRNRVIRFVPWWVVGAAALVALTGAFAYFHTRLGTLAAPVHEQLAQIGLDDFTSPAVAAPSAGPRLKMLLTEDVARGSLDVEESGNRTLITLVAPDLFASGSAKVNPARYEVLADVANAIDQVPGRVLVVGHTDDSPLRSFRYRDNYELSRERAVQVVEIMKLAIDDPSRLEFTGVGPSQPRYTPPSLPENRARNRRVEIVHVAED